MKILLIHRYFWPDTPPYASMLRTIGQRLVEDGHDVTVLTGLSPYKSVSDTTKMPSTESLGGMNIVRLHLFREHGRSVVLRLFNMFYFPLRILFFRLFTGKYDVIMASTAPPVVVGFAAALRSRISGSHFLYHCMDIHPEIGRLSGEFSNSLLYKTLSVLDRFSCKTASSVIVLSEDMKNSLIARNGYHAENCVVLNNFSMQQHGGSIEVPEKFIKPEGRFRILFAGNIGRYQGVEAFIDAMRQLVHRPEIEMVFLGEGKALESLQYRSQGLDNVHFFPHQEVAVARQIIADADLGIVSLARDVYRYAYPSKTMTYLDEGCPLLVSVEADSELADFVENEQIGLCVIPDDPESIADAIQRAVDDRQFLKNMKSNARTTVDRLFSHAVIMDKWSSLVASTGDAA